MTRARDLAKLISGSSTLGGTGELVLKDVDTADGSSPKITFQTGDTDIAADDVLGTIDFQAPDEGTGTDALLVAAGIEAVSEGDFSASSNATKLSFKTGASETATEKMTIKSDGKVGIGTILPNSSLEVSKTGASAGANFEIASLTADFGSATTNDSFGGYLSFRHRTGGNILVEPARIGVVGKSNNKADLVFYGNGGTTSLNAPTELMRLLHGGGITFNGDTAGANALDDYEEGSYTPSFATSSGGAITISTVYGRYRKIGSLVYVIAGFTNQSTTASSYSGALKCTLPFTANDLGGGYRDMTSVVANIGVFSSGGAGIVGMVDSSTEVFFYAQGSTGWGTPSISGNASGKYFHFSLCYRTA